jgi:uncharacterized membrane protein YgcG
MKSISQVIMHSLLLSILLISACSSEKYVSNWNTDAIIVDGNQSDWEGKLNYIEDERAAVGAFNDNENLYLCLTTDDRGKIMQLLNLGMTLWLEPDNDNIRTRGIKYPMQSEDFDREGIREARGKVAQDNYIEKLLVDFQRKQPELQIVNEDNYSLYMYPIDNDSGINIKLGMSMQQFVYEISIPIGDNKNEFNLALSPGDNLTIGFETNEFQKPDGDRGSGMSGGGGQPTGGMTGGGRSGGGRSGGGGRKGSQGSGIYGRPEPIDVEINVKLAKSP